MGVRGRVKGMGMGMGMGVEGVTCVFIWIWILISLRDGMGLRCWILEILLVLAYCGDDGGCWEMLRFVWVWVWSG